MSQTRMRTAHSHPSHPNSRAPKRKSSHHTQSSTAFATARLNSQSPREMNFTAAENTVVERKEEEKNNYTPRTRSERRSSTTETPPQLVAATGSEIRLQLPSSEKPAATSQRKKAKPETASSVGELLELDNARRDELKKQTRNTFIGAKYGATVDDKQLEQTHSQTPKNRKK